MANHKTTDTKLVIQYRKTMNFNKINCRITGLVLFTHIHMFLRCIVIYDGLVLKNYHKLTRPIEIYNKQQCLWKTIEC